jgi:hypothetical protein
MPEKNIQFHKITTKRKFLGNLNPAKNAEVIMNSYNGNFIQKYSLVASQEVGKFHTIFTYKDRRS